MHVVELALSSLVFLVLQQEPVCSLVPAIGTAEDTYRYYALGVSCRSEHASFVYTPSELSYCLDVV